ncbi:MAG: FKBP-type peptidyl-prolyl cis-trans isomerase [Prevotellaceae bacterium]|nr:FKBP-type peptidyl-prolyl cis-trans isomerase [Prevotellaceae bacterium]
MPAAMAALVLLASRCAENPSESWQDTELQLIKSTVKVLKVRFPAATPIEEDSSLWIIHHGKKVAESVKKPQDEGYVEFGYHGELLPISRSVVYQTTDSLEARRLGTFAATTHYAPIFSFYHKDYMQAALYKALGRMSEGDTLTVLSASWHAFGATGTTGVAANTPVIFTITLNEILANADSAAAREQLMLKEYVDAYNSDGNNAAQFVPAKDSTGAPLPNIYVCYLDAVPLTDSTPYAKTGDVLNLKYTGYYLRDGFLLDSNVGKDVYAAGWSVDTTSSTSAYQTYYKHTFSKALLSTTSIKAFDAALLNLAAGSKIEVVFTSDYGYGAAGTTTSAARPIYPYTPLRFRISFASIVE